MSDKNLLIGGTTYPHTKTPLQIRRELNDAKFDKFFGFPTSDKSQVSSVSCKLFVDHVLRESDKRIEQLEKLITQEQNRAGRIGTHSDDCHTWGHQHYECLLRKFEEAQKGHARYEYVRKLNGRQFNGICITNICDGIPFDELIDAGIAAIQEGK